LKKSQKSPKTNALLVSKQVLWYKRTCFTGTNVQILTPEELLQLLPNYALKSMIIEWLERNPNYKD
jgi:hypothetical protein